MSWSIEGFLDDTRRGFAWAANELLETLWPPRSRYDGADQLTDAEEERESWEPFECIACGARYATSGDHECPTLDGQNPADAVNPWEPELNSSERVAVRQLIEERFGDQTTKADRLDAEMWRATVGGDAGRCTESLESFGSTYSCDLTHGHTGMHTVSGGPSWFVGKTDSAATETAAVSPVPCQHGDSGEAVSATPPAPASPHSQFIAGYRAAIDLIENKAQADVKLADSLPEDHAIRPQSLRDASEWATDLARYMRAIEPKK